MATEAQDVDGLPVEGELEVPAEQVTELVEEPAEDTADIEADKPPEQEATAEEKPEGEKAEAAEEDDDEPLRHKKTSKERREERRRTERRIREERDFLLQQNQDILRRLAQIEGATIETRVVTVDSQLQECLNDASTAENLELDAQQQGDWDGVRQARRLREAAQNRAGLFKTEKERLTQALAQRNSQPQNVAPQPGAADIQRLSAQFRADKPWLQFATNGNPMNAETAVALSIDHALKKEGRLSEYDEGYWQELGKRTKAALPHMFGETTEAEDADEGEVTDEVRQVVQKAAPKAAQQSVKARKGPVVGSSGAQASSGGTKKRISPERVAAMKEIGVWDDPKERAAYIKEYEDWDRKHGVQI